MIEKLKTLFESMILAFEESGRRRAEQYIKLYGPKFRSFE